MFLVGRAHKAHAMTMRVVWVGGVPPYRHTAEQCLRFLNFSHASRFPPAVFLRFSVIPHRWHCFVMGELYRELCLSYAQSEVYLRPWHWNLARNGP